MGATAALHHQLPRAGRGKPLSFCTSRRQAPKGESRETLREAIELNREDAVNAAQGAFEKTVVNL